MPQTLTLEIADDGAVSVSVEMDGSEPQMLSFENVEEALQAVQDLLTGEEPSPDAMWNEEADARAQTNTEMETM